MKNKFDARWVDHYFLNYILCRIFFLPHRYVLIYVYTYCGCKIYNIADKFGLIMRVPAASIKDIFITLFSPLTRIDISHLLMTGVIFPPAHLFRLEKGSPLINFPSPFEIRPSSLSHLSISIIQRYRHTESSCFERRLKERCGYVGFGTLNTEICHGINILKSIFMRAYPRAKLIHLFD